jgi:hypothetical protein
MFRFTIRDVLWLTLVVGLLLTWAAQYGRDKAARTSLQKENEWLQWGIKTAGYRLYFEPGISNPFLEGTYYGDDNGPPDPAAATATDSDEPASPHQN